MLSLSNLISMCFTFALVITVNFGKARRLAVLSATTVNSKRRKQFVSLLFSNDFVLTQKENHHENEAELPSTEQQLRT